MRKCRAASLQISLLAHSRISSLRNSSVSPPASSPSRPDVEMMSLNRDHALPLWGALAGRDARVEASRPDVLLLAAAVVVHDDRVLVVRRSQTEQFLPSVWGVPCGKVDPGEEADEAAVRELREETGLTGTVVRRLGHSVFRSRWRGHTVENVQINFLVRPLGTPDRIRLPKADQAAAWLPRGEIDQFDGLDQHNLDVLGQWLTMND